MKKMIFLACVLFTASVSAEEQLTVDGTVFKTTDDSPAPAAQLCMAALESREALRDKARELNMNSRDLDEVSCNDMSLVEFARNYRDDMRQWSIATVQ